MRCSYAIAWMVLVLGCSSKQGPPTQNPAASASAAAANAGAAGAEWSEIHLVLNYGPCPADGRPCHKEWTIYHSGRFTLVETPNPTPEERKKDPTSASTKMIPVVMGPDDFAKIKEIANTPEFGMGMDKGFSCSKPSPDASLSLVVVNAMGGKKTQDVTACVNDPKAGDNTAKAMVQILRKDEGKGK